MLEFVLFFSLVMIGLPVAIFSLQVICAILLKSKPLPLSISRPHIAIIVPAHNEQAMIGATVQNLLRQLTEKDQLIVVADNCSDMTAQIAKEAGAEVIERFNTELRGKGYALDFGMAHCAKNPPEVVIIVDADCQLSENAIDVLARQCMVAHHPVQAAYFMRAPDCPTLKQKIAEFAWVVKNLVRPLGSKALGGSCQLMGTGMAFPWEVICDAKLASGEIVEDMKLGLDLAMSGKAPVFSHDVQVTSDFPQDQAGTQTQRTRWEHGHLGMIALAPDLFFHAIKDFNFGLFTILLDLIVPPLALLVMLCVIVSALSVTVFFFFGMPIALAYCALSLLFMMGSSVLLAWVFFGRKIIDFADLAYTPVYAMSKIPLYLSFLVKRQTAWIRTKRENDE